VDAMAQLLREDIKVKKGIRWLPWQSGSKKKGKNSMYE